MNSQEKINQFIEDYKTLYELGYVDPGLDDHLVKTRQRIHADDIDDTHAKRTDIEVNVSNTNYSDGKKPLHSEFVLKLINYIDSFFPKPGFLRSNIKAELRKHVRGSEDELLKTHKKVGDLVYKEYIKFIDNVGKRVGKVQIDP